MTYILVILPIFIGLCFAERALVLWQINNITEKRDVSTARIIAMSILFILTTFFTVFCAMALVGKIRGGALILFAPLLYVQCVIIKWQIDNIKQKRDTARGHIVAMIALLGVLAFVGFILCGYGIMQLIGKI